MAEITESMSIERPLREVYERWTDFESFPEFMEGVDEVRQVGADELYWKADVLGVEREWRARITEQVPLRRISWESIEGARNAGTVEFREFASGATKVTLTIDFEPEGAAEKTADALGLVYTRVTGDLLRFKEHMERASAT